MKKYVKMYRTVLSIFSTESTFKRKGKKAQETLEQHIILKQRCQRPSTGNNFQQKESKYRTVKQVKNITMIFRKLQTRQVRYVPYLQKRGG
jgi:hypothetical protein